MEVVKMSDVVVDSLCKSSPEDNDDYQESAES